LIIPANQRGGCFNRRILLPQKKALARTVTITFEFLNIRKRAVMNVHYIILRHFNLFFFVFRDPCNRSDRDISVILYLCAKYAKFDKLQLLLTIYDCTLTVSFFNIQNMSSFFFFVRTFLEWLKRHNRIFDYSPKDKLYVRH